MLPISTEKQLTTWSWILHAVGIAVTAVLVSGIIFLFIRPMDDRETELAQKAKELTASLDFEDAVQSEHELLTAKTLEAGDMTETLLERLPNVPRESEFLGQITTLAREVGLSIVDYRPGNVSEKNGYKQMTLALSSDGSYVSVCSFLHQIHQLPRLSRVLALDVAPLGEGVAYKMMLTLTIFFAADSKLSIAGREDNHV